ncbi:MAG: redoxin domain-containing protein [Phycisphaerae bacterium]
MTNIRAGWVAALLPFVAPAWVSCGFCGDVGGEGRSYTHAEIGKPAPDFTLKDIQGKEHKLSDLRGKIVVLEWINHECPVSNRYTKNGAMKETIAKFADKPVVWLAIDSSHFCERKIDSIRKWVAKNSIEYPLLLDAPGKVGRSYGAKTTPHMFVIDRKGVLAYMGAIDDDAYGIKETKRNYVEQSVTALLNGSAVATPVTKSFGCSVKYKQ